MPTIITKTATVLEISTKGCLPTEAIFIASNEYTTESFEINSAKGNNSINDNAITDVSK